MRLLRLSLKCKERNQHVIICICRGKSDREIARAIDNGASSLRELQACGIGDQCGSCHNSLRTMLSAAATAAAASSIPMPCPACTPAVAAAAHAHA